MQEKKTMRISSNIPNYAYRKVYHQRNLDNGEYDSEIGEFKEMVMGEEITYRAIYPKNKFAFFGYHGKIILGFADDCIVEIKNSQDVNHSPASWVLKQISKK